ncbi:MAG: hypothetical protein GX894_00550 [Clostridia bacterium]|nr:hypothetical protein [Clostridia bacterium]
MRTSSSSTPIWIWQGVARKPAAENGSGAGAQRLEDPAGEGVKVVREFSG